MTASTVPLVSIPMNSKMTLVRNALLDTIALVELLKNIQPRFVLLAIIVQLGLALQSNVQEGPIAQLQEQHQLMTV